MPSFFARAAVLLAPLFVALSSCSSTSSTTKLPADFTPPQVFKNTNLLRTIDLTKPYAREIVAVIVENASKEPQAEYYVSFDEAIADKLSYVEARDKKGSAAAEFAITAMEGTSPTKYYKVNFDKPLPAGETLTLQLVIGTTDVLTPVPAEIKQVDQQYLQWTSTQYWPSPYVTEKQKTKLKLPNQDVPEFSSLPPKSDGTEDPVKVGSQLTFGPYSEVAPGNAGETISVRYEHTSPVIRMDKLERDIEVSHWGGNLAIEERYWMTNAGAALKNQFSRVQWAATAYYNPPTAAIKMLTFPLAAGAQDAYFTDEIGNVSTSRFRSNAREALLEIKPRYPVFGGWNYSFVVGWNNDLKNYVREKPSGEDFVLKVPFLDGPKDSVVYKEVEVTVILPEGATDVQLSAPIPVNKEERYFHKTFMDTLGRTAVKLYATNVADEQHHKEMTVTYHLPKSEFYRKPLVFTTAFMTLFTLSWMFSKINVKIAN